MIRLISMVAFVVMFAFVVRFTFIVRFISIVRFTPVPWIVSPSPHMDNDNRDNSATDDDCGETENESPLGGPRPAQPLPDAMPGIRGWRFSGFGLCWWVGLDNRGGRATGTVHVGDFGFAAAGDLRSWILLELETVGVSLRWIGHDCR